MADFMYRPQGLTDEEWHGLCDRWVAAQRIADGVDPLEWREAMTRGDRPTRISEWRRILKTLRISPSEESMKEMEAWFGDSLVSERPHLRYIRVSRVSDDSAAHLGPRE